LPSKPESAAATMSAMGKALGAALGVGGAVMVYMQLSASDPAAEAKMPEEVKRSPLKKTLSNAGLYPMPEKADGKKLQRTASGSMAVFSSGEPGAALTKGGGEPL